MIKTNNRVILIFSDMFKSLIKMENLVFFNFRSLKQHLIRSHSYQGKKKMPIEGNYSDIFGLLGEQDLIWIFQEIYKGNDGINIIEIGAGEGQVTCYLGEACLGTKKRVYTLLPYDSNSDDLQVWHQNIIRKALVPYVVPVLWEGFAGIQQMPDKIHVVFLGNEIVDIEMWKNIKNVIFDRLTPVSLIISIKNNENARTLCLDSKMFQHGDVLYWWRTNSGK